MIRPLMQSVRALARRPSFSLAVVVLVALGIGAVTVVFSVADAVLLRPLPYPEPDRLVYFSEPSHPMPLFRQWRELESFQQVVASWAENQTLLGDFEPRQIPVAQISEGFLETFGASASIGRLLQADDWGSGRPVAVLGHRAWREVWGADPEIEGRLAQIEGRSVEIVGVLDPAFTSPEALVGDSIAVWTPLDVVGHRYASERDVYVLQVAARLTDTAALDAAQVELDTLARRNAEEFPDSDRSREGQPFFVPLQPLLEATAGEARQGIGTLGVSVALMLLIAVANVAGLFLTRGSQRRAEIAVRTALGAGRLRLVRQLLLESVLLSLAGGALGIGLAFAGTRVFRSAVPFDVPRLAEISVDWRVLLFATTVSFVVGVASGIWPALRAVRGSVAVRSIGQAAPTMRLHSALVVAQVALALVLLAGAALLFRSFLTLQSVDPGFGTEQLIRVAMSTGSDGSAEVPDEQVAAEVATLVERLRGVPGVEDVAAGWAMPFDFIGGGRCCWRSRFSAQADQEGALAMVHPVTSNFFSVLGQRPVSGRIFEDSEAVNEVMPAVLGRRLADRLYPGSSPIGRPFYRGQTKMEIVGVVEDVHHYGLDREPDEAVYVPYGSVAGNVPMLSLMVRAKGGDGLLPVLREAIWEVRPEQAISALEPLPARIRGSTAGPRFVALFASVFAALAALLAAGGIYAAVAYVCSLRTREVGLRLALGAKRRQIAVWVVRRGMLQVAAGALVGLLLALVASRLLEEQLFGVSAQEPLSLVMASVGLLVVGLAACAVPASRAARVEPMETLRSE